MQSSETGNDENDKDSNDKQNPGNSAANQSKSQKVKRKARDKVNEAGQVLRGKLIRTILALQRICIIPTDLSLLNESREKLEVMIDVLHEPLCGTASKPRTYRQRARKDYLSMTKCRKNLMKKMRKAVKKQRAMLQGILVLLIIFLQIVVLVFYKPDRKRSLK